MQLNVFSNQEGVTVPLQLVVIVAGPLLMLGILIEPAFVNSLPARIGIALYLLFLSLFVIRLHKTQQGLQKRYHHLLEKNSKDQKVIDHLNQVRDQLLADSEEYKKFVYLASHDLKEPARMVATYLGLLQKENSNILSEKSNRYMKYALEGSERLCGLVDSILSFYRLETKNINKEEISLANVLEYAKTHLHRLIQEKRAVISSKNLPSGIVANEYQMQILFQNLLSNSIKFSKPDLPPIIEIEGKCEGNNLLLIFRDNGIGIPSSEFGRIFQLFHRLHARSAYPGDGIGLSAVKKVVEAHDGSIQLESKPNEGTVFLIKLPASPKPV